MQIFHNMKFYIRWFLFKNKVFFDIFIISNLIMSKLFMNANIINTHFLIKSWITSRVIESHIRSLLFLNLDFFLYISSIKNLIIWNLCMNDNIIKTKIFLNIKFDLKCYHSSHKVLEFFLEYFFCLKTNLFKNFSEW